MYYIPPSSITLFLLYYLLPNLLYSNIINNSLATTRYNDHELSTESRRVLHINLVGKALKVGVKGAPP